MKFSAAVIIFLFSCDVMLSSRCPKNCECSHAMSEGTCTECDYAVVKCDNAGLTEIPGDIPDSIVEISLINNPSLRFNHDAFLRFKNLRSLKLNFNLLSNAFVLPVTLKYLNLRGNKFNITAVHEMFKKTPQYLEVIYLEGTDTAFDKNFNIFPANIKHLHLFHFKIKNLSARFFQHFTNLQGLTLEHCGIEAIEAGAFDHLENLKKLDIQNNGLKTLPDKLFSKCNQLIALLLSGNHLGRLPDLSGPGYFQTLSCERCGIRSLTSADIAIELAYYLNFGWNQIESFNLNSTKYVQLDLSNNHITKLNDFAFHGLHKRVKSISLMNNNLTQISQNAFRGLTYIDELYLQRKNFSRLPERIFEGITINTLLLYGNKLSTMNDVLKGVKTSLRTIALFESPNLKTVVTKDFDMLGNESSIFADCKSLRKIVGHRNFRATIKCSPSKAFRIYTNTLILNRDGFKCTGEFSGFRGMYQCSPCGTGSYSHCPGTDCPRDACRACPAGGFYQDEVAATSCKRCPLGQYVQPQSAPGKSPLDCQTCPSGTNTSDFAFYRACRCLSGFARESRFGECHKCNSTGIESKDDYQILKKGFWWTWHSNLTAKDEFRVFLDNLKTKDDSYDRKASTFTGFLPQPHMCPISGSCLGGLEAKCQQNYTGVFCAVCSKGYFKTFHRCIKCHSPAIAALIFLGYFALFIVVCILISWTDKMNAEEGNQRTMADIILSNLKILLGFYQVLSGIIKTLSHIRWPTTLTKTIAIFEFLQFEVLSSPSLECVKAEWRLNALREFWLGLLITVTFPLLVLLYFGAKKLYLHVTIASLSSFKNKSFSCAKNCLRTIALFYFATYTITSRRVIQILPISCHRFCINKNKDGSCFMELSYMRADYGQKCLSEGSAVSLNFIGHAALVIPFGLPMLLLLLLHHFRAESREENGNDEDASKMVYIAWQEDADLLLHRNANHKKETVGNFALKFAYENYNESCWYWEALEMARKLIMTAGFAALIQHTRVGLGGLITVAWFFAILHALRRPIKDNFENFLQLLSLCIIPLNMSIGAVLQASNIRDEDIINVVDDSWWLGILLVMINSLIAVFVFGRLLRAIAKKLKVVCMNRPSCRDESPSCVCCIKRDPIDQLAMGIHDSDSMN